MVNQNINKRLSIVLKDMNQESKSNNNVIAYRDRYQDTYQDRYQDRYMDRYLDIYY